MKKVLVISVVIAALLFGSAWFSRNVSTGEDGGVVSTRGIHTHPEISIFIDDAPYAIPANIGIGAVHQPMHTHAPDGVVHVEIQGVVRERDMTLGNFFTIWGENFSSTELIDQTGVVQMTVNGAENEEFESYVMQDGDKIELRISS